MALSKFTAAALVQAHKELQSLTDQRRKQARYRSSIAQSAQAEGATISEIQSLLGLSRTGVVKILAGDKAGDKAEK